MIQEIIEKYNDNILKKAMDLYGISKDDLKDLGALESFVYEYKVNDTSYILKITHSIRRSVDYIKGELDWLDHLYNNGVSVSRAVPSKSGNLVEIIGSGNSYFLVISYEKARGKLATANQWNSDLFQKWGQVMGQMHRLTKNYKLRDKSIKRKEWYEDDQLNIEKYIPLSQKRVIENSHKLINQLKSLPKDSNSYGLVHMDLHQENFFIHNGKITVFDFDDIQYDWFANDIAIALYYAIWWNPLKDNYNKQEFSKYFLDNFLKGYRKENTIDDQWLKKIPDFMRLRHILVYVIFHQIFDLNNLTENQHRLLTKYRYDIENEVPLY